MNGLTGRGGAASKELRRKPVSCSSRRVSFILCYLGFLSRIKNE